MQRYIFSSKNAFILVLELKLNNLQQMKKIQIFLILIFFGSIVFPGCNSDNKSKRKSINDLEIIRFDQLLIEMDTSSIQQSFFELKNSYPSFIEIYFSHVLPIKGYETENDSFFINLKGFISDPAIKEIYSLTQDLYKDFDEETNDLAVAFNKMDRIFPGQKKPRIYTFISEFSLQRFIFDDANQDGLAIGLDLFLGQTFDYARLEQGENTFSNYLTRSYDNKHLVKKVMEAWIEDKMGPQTGSRLIDQMMYNGKKLYLLKQVLPEIHDSIIMEYSQKQMDWIEGNEEEMWVFYLKNELFYSTDQYKIKRLTFPAPNSEAIGMPSSAPGRTGNYLGWKIVENFTKRNPEVDFQKLLEMDSQRLFELSKYKPGKR